jgi:hypothetical protein
VRQLFFSVHKVFFSVSVLELWCCDTACSCCSAWTLPMLTAVEALLLVVLLIVEQLCYNILEYAECVRPYCSLFMFVCNAYCCLLNRRRLRHSQSQCHSLSHSVQGVRLVWHARHNSSSSSSSSSSRGLVVASRATFDNAE